MTFKDFVLSYPQVLCYDDPSGDPPVDDPSGDPPAGDPSGDPPAGDPPKNEETFTQIQLNEYLATDRRKHEAATKKVADQAKAMEQRLEKMIADKQTSDAQRAGLESDLEDFRASQRSEEEQREHVALKAKEAHDNEVKELTEAAGTWETLYKQSTIKRTLTDAAVKHDAFNPKQIVALLEQKTEMRPVKEADGVTVIPNKFEARTAIDVREEDGTILTAWKTPSEAVEGMKNDPDEDGNLFRNAVLAGIGGGTAATTGKNSAGVDPSKLSIEEKARRFKEDPESLGLKPKRNY